jgi:hypothetical protein
MLKVVKHSPIRMIVCLVISSVPWHGHDLPMVKNKCGIRKTKLTLSGETHLFHQFLRSGLDKNVAERPPIRDI